MDIYFISIWYKFRYHQTERTTFHFISTLHAEGKGNQPEKRTLNVEYNACLFHFLNVTYFHNQFLIFQFGSVMRVQLHSIDLQHREHFRGISFSLSCSVLIYWIRPLRWETLTGVSQASTVMWIRKQTKRNRLSDSISDGKRRKKQKGSKYNEGRTNSHCPSDTHPVPERYRQHFQTFPCAVAEFTGFHLKIINFPPDRHRIRYSSCRGGE